MEITLRRAAVIQDLLRETRNSLTVAPAAQVSVFTEVERAVQAEREKMFANINRRDALDRALTVIRNAVARANAEAGVSDLLAEQARLGRVIEDLTPFAQAKPYEGAEVSQKRAERAANQKEPQVSLYGRGDAPVAETILVSLLNEEDIENARLKLLEAKRAKTLVKDRLSEINAVTRITLPDDVAAVLKAEHIA